MEEGGTATECRIFSWLWQLLALVKGDGPLFVTSNPCVPLANTMGRSAVCFFFLLFFFLFSLFSFSFSSLSLALSRKVIQFCAVFYAAARSVHTSDFRLVKN